MTVEGQRGGDTRSLTEKGGKGGQYSNVINRRQNGFWVGLWISFWGGVINPLDGPRKNLGTWPFKMKKEGDCKPGIHVEKEDKVADIWPKVEENIKGGLESNEYENRQKRRERAK